MKRETLCLSVIVLAEFLGTSLWFSANAVTADLARDWGATIVELGYLTSAVQLGFIVGALGVALSGLADRFRASGIFFVSCLLGATANAGFAWWASSVGSGVGFRFVTGLALAGIYPLGMKLVVSWSPQRKGTALGWLVGMLALGTSFPHLVRALGTQLHWKSVVELSSVMAVMAGLAVARVGDGPHQPEAGRMVWGGVFRAFRNPDFRAAAWGYFGHMWELYAAWTLAPLLIAPLVASVHGSPQRVALLSFVFIAAGGVGCVAGGYVSRRVGSAVVAATALATSGAICLMYPWLAGLAVALPALALLVWGVAVMTDSPQFSALAAAAAPTASLGSALAIMNSIGFLISIAAIELTTALWSSLGPMVTWLLVPGPALGLLGMWRRTRTQVSENAVRFTRARQQHAQSGARATR